MNQSFKTLKLTVSNRDFNVQLIKYVKLVITLNTKHACEIM